MTAGTGTRYSSAMRCMRRRLILALLLPWLAGCASTPPPAVRNSDLLRDLFYPPSFPRGERLADTPGRAFDHAAYAAILKAVVKSDGAVDYAAVKRLEPQLDLYLVDLGNVEIATLRRHEQLALLLNAYNAFTLKMMAENPGLKSPTDVPASGGWTKPTWVIDLGAVSMEQLEHEWIRRRFHDPRVHVALVRGARGSPPLRAEPYTGKNLDAQLDDQARRVLADPRYCAWDAARGALRLSSIFDRYRADFADDDRGLVRALLAWMPPATAQAIKNANTFDIEFVPFDWKLNGTW
jgi:hypothetical protein